MNNGFVGYDKEKVVKLIDDIQSCYDKLYTKLTSDIESKYIVAMGKSWVCPDAVNFFKSDFLNYIYELITDINNSMISVSEAINSSCEAYARSCGDIWSRKNIILKQFQGYVIDGVIKDYDASLGGQGGSMQNYDNAKSILSSIKAECANCTANMANISLQCGFVGADQQQKLQSALKSIDKKISDDFNQITTIVDNKVKQAIEQYSMVANKVTSSFQGVE